MGKVGLRVIAVSWGPGQFRPVAVSFRALFLVALGLRHCCHELLDRFFCL